MMAAIFEMISRRDLVQVRHPQRHVGAQFLRQRDQQPGRLRGIQMRQDQRDGLRMLVVDEFGELLRIGLLQRVETGQLGAQRLHQPVHQLAARARGRTRVISIFLRVVDAALEHVVVRHRHLVELFENALGLVVADGGDARHLVADGLHFFFVHLPQDLARWPGLPE